MFRQCFRTLGFEHFLRPVDDIQKVFRFEECTATAGLLPVQIWPKSTERLARRAASSCNASVASLGWVTPGAATKGVTTIFPEKKLTTFLAVSYTHLTLPTNREV